MNILFLIYFDKTSSSQLGVIKKINYQIKAMEECGHNVDLGYCKNDSFIIENNNITMSKFYAPSGVTHYRKSISRILSKHNFNYDLVYVRFPGSIDYYIYKTFSALRKKGVKVVLEMPTYPIKGEMVNILKDCYNKRLYPQMILRSIVYLLHCVFCRLIKKDITCIVSYSSRNRIWGARVINIENGIDCESIRIKTRSDDQNDLSMIFVAVFSIWHGLDRLISGLKNYYSYNPNPSTQVTLTLIGDSDELKKIIASDDFQMIKQYVHVLGSLHGEDLDDEYDKANVAISSLGMHRIGLSEGSTLKTKEYCAKGIPFVYGYRERGIDTSFPYALRVPANEEPIDINSIVDFYNSIRFDDYPEKMHSFSKKYDWTYQMKQFFDELKKIEG